MRKQTWDYKVVACVETRQVTLLNENGDNGWELVTVVRDSSIFYLYFKRPAEWTGY